MQPPRAVDEEGRERDDQQHLAELRGLDLEEGQGDPAMRVLDRRHPQYDHVERDHQAVEEELVFAQARVVDLGQHERSQEPDSGVDRLTVDVVGAGGAGGPVQGDE